ncbi:hypothetical protein HHK36_002561 [Tetracentron sinense]|uniref:Uncharacterized protein n=1 Tax=Tetracentron sinense TaxID=13715 RepID=A0A835DNF7_TETSI|nr:hypothetical protein HHK36_002561 [Tetracentron sinense]
MEKNEREYSSFAALFLTETLSYAWTRRDERRITDNSVFVLATRALNCDTAVSLISGSTKIPCNLDAAKDPLRLGGRNDFGLGCCNQHKKASKLAEGSAFLLSALFHFHDAGIFFSLFLQDLIIEYIDGLATVLSPQHFEKFQNDATNNALLEPFVCHKQVDNDDVKPFDITQVQGKEDGAKGKEDDAKGKMDGAKGKRGEKGQKKKREDELCKSKWSDKNTSLASSNCLRPLIDSSGQ